MMLFLIITLTIKLLIYINISKMGKNIITEKGMLYHHFFINNKEKVFLKKPNPTFYGVGTERIYIHCYVQMKKYNSYWKILKIIPLDKEVFGYYGEHTEVL